MVLKSDTVLPPHIKNIANLPNFKIEKQSFFFIKQSVGSFLRPASVHAARKQNLEGSITDEQLREVEDAAIKTVVAQQEAAGLRGISDGEFRREYFHLDFLKHVGGVSITKNKLTGEKAEATPPQCVLSSLPRCRFILKHCFFFSVD